LTLILSLLLLLLLWLGAEGLGVNAGDSGMIEQEQQRPLPPHYCRPYSKM